MRFARWAEEGVEPDYRFTLANERTFLAWLRTALGLLVAAVAASQFAPAGQHPGALRVIAMVLACLGTVLAGLSYRRWAQVQRAMRHEAPLPMSRAPSLTCAIVTVAAAITVVVAVVMP